MKTFRPSIHLPINLAMIVILLAKLAGDKLGFCRLSNSVFSPSTVYSLSCSRTFDCSKAKTLLGYSPIVSFQVCLTERYVLVCQLTGMRTARY
ncbi:hypothetical protein BHE74_00040342 [Ensete ventricosum]|nr:hypothetical protein GW17_00004192 [Ensete ventricosum]RWW53187.1 hypothetical protein BHE74_00040342 [Ensete ventricosum]RZS00537.1 hypothetical protein BHM03_00030257 [Ensete ventricosum]